VNGIDRQSAAAESQLDRIDDGPGGPGGDRQVELSDGMHIETAPPDLAGDDSDDGGHVLVDHAELVDGIVEAFDARDMDTLADLCADDCEIPGLASDLDDLDAAMADLWERRPTITMTRSVDDDGIAVGVLWERGETAGWSPIGTCHVDVDEHGQAAVLEFSDDVGLLDQLELDPPDGDLEEGATWAEWDEGADGG
jgi:hypothetical protein